jgi:elongation factor P
MWGRGGAFMQVEMKDIEAGTKTNQRIRTEDKVYRAFVEPRDMTFLYQDGENYIFMDKENYEQLSLSQDFLESQYEYLLPNTDVQVNFHNDRPIGVQLPSSVMLTVVDTEPNLKGATATSSYKLAKMETGLVVMVPPFILQAKRSRSHRQRRIHRTGIIGGHNCYQPGLAALFFLPLPHPCFSARFHSASWSELGEVGICFPAVCP